MKTHYTKTAFSVVTEKDAAIFRVYPYGDEGKAEAEIVVFSRGHFAEAVNGLLHGGKMPAIARAADMAIFRAVAEKGFAFFASRYRLNWDASDDRRARCYARMLDRAGITYKRQGTFFEI